MFSRLLLTALCLLGLSRLARAAAMTLGDEVDTDNLITKAAYYGDHDNRQTEDEYASSHGISPNELKNKLSATGLLKCGDLTLSANIVYKVDIVATAAHFLRDPYTCIVKTESVDKCIFSYNFYGKETSVPVDHLVASGLKCPSITDERDDWAVLKLKYPAHGPTPYRVPTGDGPDIWHSQKVIAVAGGSIDFCLHDRKTGLCKVNRATGRQIFPKTVEDCTIGQVYVGMPPTYFSSVCGASGGSSGGGVLDTLSASPTLLGIFVGNQETKAMVENEVKTGVAQGGPYNEKTWASYHVPVAGAFLRAIRKAGDE